MKMAIEYVPYRSEKTLDFRTWCSRRHGIPGPVDTAFRLCRKHPELGTCVRSYGTGSHDLRRTLHQVMAIPRGDMALATLRMGFEDALVQAWRKYQAYLRMRGDRERMPLAVVNPGDPIAQPQSDA